LYSGNTGVSRRDIEELLKEMEMMTSLGRHDNVIQLIGCACSNDGKIILTLTPAKAFLKIKIKRMKK